MLVFGDFDGIDLRATVPNYRQYNLHLFRLEMPQIVTQILDILFYANGAHYQTSLCLPGPWNRQYSAASAHRRRCRMCVIRTIYSQKMDNLF
jgi:hypothetical protein